ncbi:hypothetical protein Glove_103g167 [Diversispora epigaea]|uniref:Uncharacterized protein n=1 Tax=Diversispora epigaea TaxID=1348612 RepID=A0A397J3Q4_9GLOM|nr:hypothetical protein Glove_103g167 [Diversispora epigaea]
MSIKLEGLKTSTYDRKDKKKIYHQLVNSAKMYNPNWDIDVNTICVMSILAC